MDDLLTITQAALKIKSSRSLLQKRCQDGTLPSIRVGKTYRIAAADLAAWVRRQVHRSPSPLHADDDLQAMLDAWAGYLLNVRGLAPRTVETHRGSMVAYLRRLPASKDSRVSHRLLFDRKSLIAAFGKIPARSFALKLNIFNALRSLGAYLVLDGTIKLDVLAQLAPLKPRRQHDPRRTHLKPTDLSKLFENVLTRPEPAADNITLAALLATLAYAGLRVSEACQLRMQDVDLDDRILKVRHGKGGKDRRVGISNALLGHLQAYHALRPRSSYFFAHPEGAPWSRHQVAKQVQRLARHLDLDITPHGLRRTFATLAAGQGRSVNAIRIALGHSDLSTTQAYLRQSETEVVEAMREW